MFSHFPQFLVKVYKFSEGFDNHLHIRSGRLSAFPRVMGHRNLVDQESELAGLGENVRVHHGPDGIDPDFFKNFPPEKLEGTVYVFDSESQKQAYEQIPPESV